MTSDLAQRTLPEGPRLITASGELDRTEVPALRFVVKNAFAEGTRQLILDMSEVTYIDSSVLAALIADSIEAENRDCALVIVTGSAGIMRSFELKGLMQVMRIAETLEEALASLGA